MPSRFLEPPSSGLRQPTDNAKNNGQMVNPPRYAELGGLTTAGKIAPDVNATSNSNNLSITKPGGGRR